jgi:hypothetical protein
MPTAQAAVKEWKEAKLVASLSSLEPFLSAFSLVLVFPCPLVPDYRQVLRIHICRQTPCIILAQFELK